MSLYEWLSDGTLKWPSIHFLQHPHHLPLPLQSLQSPVEGIRHAFYITVLITGWIFHAPPSSFKFREINVTAYDSILQQCNSSWRQLRTSWSCFKFRFYIIMITFWYERCLGDKLFENQIEVINHYYAHKHSLGRKLIIHCNFTEESLIYTHANRYAATP